MNIARKVRDFAQTVDIHSMGYVDLNNCLGELRVLLARLSIEKENRLNERAKDAAQGIHNEMLPSKELPHWTHQCPLLRILKNNSYLLTASVRLSVP